MRFAWVGLHADGVSVLEALLAAGAPIRGLLTLRPDLAAKRAAAADYGTVCERYGVPLHYVANVNDAHAVRLLGELAPDVVFVVGWPQVVRAAALAVPRVGMIGSHASLLPHNRGSAPIPWSLIRGERQTGSTLVWLAENVNAGDIIDQMPIPVTPYDTCASLYGKVAAANRDMLVRLLPRLLAGERPGRPQSRANGPLLTRRRRADGRLDWSRPARAVYDAIRALTRPHPGAFGVLDGRRWLIWEAALPPASPGGVARAGEILGPIVSPVAAACGQVVACGEGHIVLLEVERDDGAILTGPELSEQPWTGRRWDERARRKGDAS